MEVNVKISLSPETIVCLNGLASAFSGGVVRGDVIVGDSGNSPKTGGEKANIGAVSGTAERGESTVEKKRKPSKRVLELMADSENDKTSQTADEDESATADSGAKIDNASTQTEIKSSTYQKQDVSTALMALAKKKGKEATKDLLEKYGASNVSGLAVEVYGDIISKAKELTGNA